MMTEQGIPADVRDFILRHIDSIAQLEALLLMRADPGRMWGAKDLSQRIYTSEQETSDLLARLADGEFLSVSEGCYRYECEDPVQHALVEKLANIYSRQLIPVTNLIHAKPRRIRQFADAFKFRKER